MKRITVSLDDDIYSSLIDYAADSSKQDLARLSISKILRDILASQLGQLNYYPMSEKRRHELHVRKLIRERAQRQLIQEDPFSIMQEEKMILSKHQ
jgi:hypothetical protein